jgi:CRP/FNR family transcriptional regulator, anaerobic regulatory protein
MSTKSRILKKNSLLSFLNQLSPLSPEFVDDVLAVLKYERREKGEHLIVEGKVCQNLYYIKKGLLRGYTESGGRNITTWVSFEHQLVTSIYGFFKNKPAKENIQAMENCEMEYIHYSDMHTLLDKHKEMAVVNRILLEEYYMYAEERAFMARLPSASSRYEFLVQSNFKFILDRVPGKYVASFLGMREETYSRLLNKRENIF